MCQQYRPEVRLILEGSKHLEGINHQLQLGEDQVHSVQESMSLHCKNIQHHIIHQVQ